MIYVTSFVASSGLTEVFCLPMLNGMTVAEIIEKLGGAPALAEELHVVPSAVRNWRRLNAFPPRLHMPITNLARQRGIHLDDAMFRELTAQERVA